MHWFKKAETNKSVALKKTAINKLSRMNSKRINNEKYLEELTDVFHIFFSHYFKIKYEFTYEEFEKEIMKKKVKKSVRGKLIALSEKIKEMRFGEDELDRTALKEANRYFMDVVKEL